MIKFYLTRVYFNRNVETTPPKELWVKASNPDQIKPLFLKMYGDNFKKYEILQQIDKPNRL